jgi:ion channel-forming bestrophin family protein
LENPFGNDVNDLPLDSYCAELSRELDTLMSVPAPKFGEHMGLSRNLNQPLWPLSHGAVEEWRNRSEGDIRSALRAKAWVNAKVGASFEDGRTGTAVSTGTTLNS